MSARLTSERKRADFSPFRDSICLVSDGRAQPTTIARTTANETGKPLRRFTRRKASSISR
jgi:hypothetical protein